MRSHKTLAAIALSHYISCAAIPPWFRSSVLTLHGRYEYHWEDGENYKRATALSAPAYVEALMTWTQNTLDDERLFPQKIGASGIQGSARACFAN